MPLQEVKVNVKEFPAVANMCKVSLDKLFKLHESQIFHIQNEGNQNLPKAFFQEFAQIKLILDSSHSHSVPSV